MPNWCLNIVDFEGKAAAIRNVKKLFNRMSKKERQLGCGQLPPFIICPIGYFFNIEWREGVLYYNTRHAPNIDVMELIAKRYGLDYTHEYEESGNSLFGKAVYKHGILTNVSLDIEDFDAMQYDENKDTTLFEGVEYECYTEILEALLERKFIS